ncbi:interferon-induced very large GTPase 1-like [Dendrobates tinctorius]|uniref:interferon-induced very large GTPase 1-like n=1 Tax=Dendrobates tinctorius TaxID=92724 RepID=UPI003CC97CFD
MADSKVKVAVRVRPMNQKETDEKAECVVYMEGNQTAVKFSSPTFDGNCPAQKEFHFDHCFWSVNDEGPAKYASQEDVFTTLGEDILDNAFRGFNSCIFAYGQTGSGKTFSMMGTDDQPGLVPRICSALFSRDVSHLTSFQVEATYLEIYNEKVQDLLRPTSDFKALRVREHKSVGPYVEGLSHHAVRNAGDIKSLILEGNKCRKISNTKMNEQSSRSHAIFTITVTQTFQKKNTVKELLSKVSLVDLAGSERISITGATGEELKESSNINKSLSSLGLVINSLAELSEGKRKSSYVNYRDSVLTWLLKNNLGGNSKTVMLATISPASINYQETLSTLKYADNAKCIVNNPRVNEDLKARTIADLAKEVKGLREQLQQAKTKHKEDLQAKLNESETLLGEFKTSWEEKLQKTKISALERQKQLQRLGIMVEHSGNRVDEDKCYLINVSSHRRNHNELFLYYLGESTKIGSGDSQDIKITGPGIELEHCVIDILQDGNIVLTPNNYAETFVNSSRVQTGVILNQEDKIMLGNKASFMLHKPTAKSKIAQESPDMVHNVPVNQPEEMNKEGTESTECSTQKIIIPQNRSIVSTGTSDNKYSDQDSHIRKITTTETTVSPKDHKDGGNSEPSVICHHKKPDEDDAVDKNHHGTRTSLRPTSQTEIEQHDDHQISKDDDKPVSFGNPMSQIVMEEYLESRNQISKDSENLNSEDNDKTAISINRPCEKEMEQNISRGNQQSKEDYKTNISNNLTFQREMEQNVSPKNQISKEDDKETDTSIHPTSQTQVEKNISIDIQTSNENSDGTSMDEAAQNKLEQYLLAENQISKADSDKTDLDVNQTSQMEIGQKLSSEPQICKDEDDDDKTEMSTNSTPLREMKQNIRNESQIPEGTDEISMNPTSQTKMETNRSSVGILPKVESLQKKAVNYIRRSREQIMAVLQKDFDKFLDKIDVENIITQDEYFKVENMENDKKARTLMNLILQKDESTCRAFLRCLELNPKEENSPEQKVKKIHSEESKKVQTDKDKMSHFQDLLKKIEFQNYWTSKLTLQKVLDIGAECLTPSISPGQNVAWYFIRKLMSLHEEARNVSTMGNRAGMSRDDRFTLDADSDLSDAIHPLDLQCAIFHCSDHFLQQEMISKMSMCQFSVPLLLPAIDSPDYTFMLWAMKGIVKKWRPQSMAESKGFQEEHLVNISMPTFSFVRLGRCRLSKSKILNLVLSSTQHCQDIFVHRDMEGGNVERTISLGLVEISWHFPSGKGIFAEPVAVTNLRGELESHLKPFRFLAEISSTVVVFMETISKSHCDLLQRYKNSSTKYLFIIAPEGQQSEEEIEELRESVMTMTERKEDRVLVITKATNEAQTVKKIRSALLRLQKENVNNLSIESMAHTAAVQEICVDENAAECQAAKEQATKITREICDVVKYKGKTMTLQAQLLKDLSKLEKECCQMKKQGNRNGEEYKSELRRKCDEIRRKQWECEVPEGIDHFIKGIETNNPSKNFYFLSWLKYSLDLAARKTLTSLQQEYKKKSSQASDSKELKEIDQKISDSSLGIEHFLREVSQFYEVWHIMGKKKCLHKERNNLPETGASLLLDGFPLELIDGDASRIPVQWITDVLNIVNSKTGGRSRIRVITVLGVQSTGKSTLLNTMFGLQFPVASGRCTRGAFMTLIKVKKNLSKELGCEFLLVIDTEGLKAPELDSLEDSYEHDNELATLVVGLSDITIVNMAMENTAEMKDILQIVVHSFLRMKEIGKKPNCQFVHQNVSDVSAPVMNMRDRNKLLEQLNEMTKTVATMEKKPQYKVFADVMEYDPEHHHWYIPSLWKGSPPMAPVSAGYSESVAEMKQNLLKLIKKKQNKPQTISEFIKWMEDLWNAVKHENFIFSFRNSKVASAYNKLSMQYSELEWKFNKLIHEWFTNTETVIKNQSEETLENKGKECCIKLESLISAEQNKLTTWVEDYFQQKTDCVYLIKYKEDFKISAKRLGENLRLTSYEKYNNAVQIQKQQLSIKNVRMKYIEEIEQKVSSLVEECRKKRHQLDDEKMEKEFENMWQHTVEELKVKPLIPRDVEKNMLLQLTKTMRDKGSAVNERLQRTQQLPKPNEKPGGEKKKGWAVVTASCKYVINLFKSGKRTENHNSFFESLLRKCCKYSKEQAGRDVDYDNTYCKHLLNIIDDTLKEESNISADVELNIKLTILGHTVEDFQKMQNNFIKKNDPYLQMETLKSEYFNTFMNVFQEKNESQNLARRIYENCLKPAVIDYTIRNLGIELVDDIMNSEGSETYTSRTFFQYTVLLNLLEENIFEKYVDYSANYEEFVKNWILEYIKAKYKNFSSIQSNILSRITKKIELLLNNTDMWNQSGNMEDFLDGFQEELSSDLVFPQETMKAILFQNSANTKEFIKNLKNFLSDIKEEIISDNESQGVEVILSKVTVKPEDVLFKKVFGCGKQCPFCKVPCEAGGEEHKEHVASVHRPEGLGTYRWESTSILCHDICTTHVCGNVTFTNKDAKLHPYKRYKEIYPDWKIQPDSSIEASDYWKFVLKEFNEQFAEEYRAKRAEHPEEWNNLTKEMAKESLKKTFNM